MMRMLRGDTNCICLGDGLNGMACTANNHSKYYNVPLVCCSCGAPAEWRLLVRCEDIEDNFWDVFCSMCAVATPSTQIEEIGEIA